MIVLLVVVALVLYAIIKAAVKSATKNPNEPTPILPTGSQRYKISGIDRETKMDTVWHCTAESPDNARVKADLEGIVVTRVDRV